MTNLTLAQATTILDGALSKGVELKLKPLTVAVLDAGGHLLALKRQDGASTLRPQIACAKASGALALGVSSRKLGELAADRPTFINAVGQLSPNGLVPSAGGVIVIDALGCVLGAVGITGDTSDNDERCALAAIVAAGLDVQA